LEERKNQQGHAAERRERQQPAARLSGVSLSSANGPRPGQGDVEGYAEAEIDKPEGVANGG
jgi:hypothetical protein